MDITSVAVIVACIAVVGIARGGIISHKMNLATLDRDANRANLDFQLKEIHTLTNDNLSRTTTRLDEALVEINNLKEILAEIRNPSGARLAGNAPVPVTDKAAERVAAATETLAAVATQRMEKGEA